MDGAAVNALGERFAKPTTVLLGDDEFIAAPAGWSVIDPASLVKRGPHATPLEVATLGALRDYVKENRDALALDKVVIHVAGPAHVALHGPLDARARARETFVVAKAADLTDSFLDRYMSIENFLIGLQVRFAPSESRAAVLRLLGNVKAETVKSAVDDGVTQTVQTRAGVALVQEVAVPNPVNLQPYRTFRDVLQPESAFILRMQQGRNGGLPEVGLFEADGGAWRLVAVDRVRDRLKLELPEGVAVLA